MPGRIDDGENDGAARSAPLPDGSYEVFVVDVDEEAGPGTVLLSLTVVAGEHKGAAFDLAASGLDGGFVELVGMPGTLSITDGVPVISIEK